VLIAAGSWIYFVLAAMAIAAIILLRTLWVPKRLPYRARGQLLTKAETRFYRALQHGVGDRWTIFAMVRIADILTVDESRSPGRGWLNRISSKHVDFVLCDPDSLDVIGAIELDDATHERADRVARDEFVNAAFAAAGVPLLRMPTQPKYELDDLRKRVKDALG
jgi:hypothetical protein